MCLLLQLNADLPEKLEGRERRLYLFTCKSKACRRKPGSVRGFRGTRLHKGTAARKAKQDSKHAQRVKAIQPPGSAAADIGSSIFTPNAASLSSKVNPFASSASNAQIPFAAKTLTSPSTDTDNSGHHDTLDLAQTFASKASLANGLTSAPVRTPWPSTSSLPRLYPSFHLDADSEYLDPSPPASSSSKTNLEVDTEATQGNEDAEIYESTMDKTFQKFASRLSQNPEQVLRYDFGGSPLLYSTLDAVGKLLSGYSLQANVKQQVQIRSLGPQLPACSNCGNKRVFELQLVPHAITMLEEKEEGLDGMEWGTIIMGVCEKSCEEMGVHEGQWGWIEEWVGVQWEEQSKAGKPT